MAVLLKIGFYLINPDALSYVEIKRDTDEVIIYLLCGRYIKLGRENFKEVFDAFDSEGLIKDKSKVEPIK